MGLSWPLFCFQLNNQNNNNGTIPIPPTLGSLHHFPVLQDISIMTSLYTTACVMPITQCVCFLFLSSFALLFPILFFYKGSSIPVYIQPVFSVWNPEALSPAHPHLDGGLLFLHLLMGVSTVRGVVVLCWGELKSDHHTTHFTSSFLRPTQHYQRFPHLWSMDASM